MAEQKVFNLERAKGLADQIAAVTGETKLDLFLSIQEEITLIFGTLGIAFSFATSDVLTKIQNLRDRRNEMIELKKINCPPEEVTLEQLIRIDIDMGTTETGYNGYNGKGKFYCCSSRTILRLMWFIDFVEDMLRGLVERTEDELSTICRESYEKCLGPHHTWIVRTTFSTSLVACPYKETFMTALQGDLPKEKVIPLIKDTAQCLSTFQERMWKFLKDNKCDNLP